MFGTNLIMDSSEKSYEPDPLFGAISKIVAHDGFYNSRMKIGQNDQNQIFSSWQYERTFLDWFLWTSLYNSSWVFRNGIDKKANAMVSDMEIHSTADPTEINNVIALYDFYKPDLKHLFKQSSIYGGAASAMLIEGFIDKDKLDKPLDVSKIPKGAKMSLYTRDRWNGLQWEGTAGWSAIGTHDFGKHEYYVFNMTGDTGERIEDGLRFHHSQCLRAGNRAPTQYTKFQLSGWDLPEGQHVIEELTRDETTRASIASLISKSLIEIVKMAGTRGLFSGISGDLGSSNITGRNELESRLKGITDYRNFNNLTFLDVNDEYQQFQLANMAGLADILEQQRRSTSGAMEIPEMILYGSADQKGLIFQKDGSTSPEIEIYQQTINNRQDDIFKPVMDKLLPVLWRIANGKDMPEGTTYIFLPTFKESQTAKLERAKLIVENVTALIEAGIFTPKMGAIEIRQHSKQTGFGSNLTDDIINKMPDELVPKTDVETTESPVDDASVKKEDVEENPKKDNPKTKYSFKKRGAKK